MGSTLGDDRTHVALVGGYEIKLKDNASTLEALEVLAARVEALKIKNGWGVGFYVPGDSVYGGPEFYGSVFIGRPLLWICADDPPTSFDPSTFTERCLKLEKMTEEDRAFLMETEGIEIEAIDDAKVHLLSWGPLCYGAVHVGVSMDEEDREEAKYKYASNQDMSQEWGTEGIDAVYLTSVEFSDALVFDHSDEKISESLAKVPELENPEFFLLCRYD